MAKHSIRLDSELLDRVFKKAIEQNRSTSQQIELWEKIGQIAEDNPELHYDFIKEALSAKSERDKGKLKPYRN